MQISLIVARAANGAIGWRGAMPWHISEDLKYFKKTTMGKPVVMGRKTFAAIGKPLPGRPNIVITRNRDFAPAGVTVRHDLPAAFTAAAATGADDIMVIGGAEIYRQALEFATRLYLTEIGADFEGDAFFPAIAPSEWTEIDRDDRAGDPPFSFVVLERKNAARSWDVGTDGEV